MRSTRMRLHIGASRLHRWLALIIGVQLLLWFTSGLVMSLLPIERVREIGEGHVYSGRRALELGLVDKLGGLADAVDEVTHRAGLWGGDVEVTVPFQTFSFTKAITHAASVSSQLEELEKVKMRLLRWDHEPLALMPQTFEVKP